MRNEELAAIANKLTDDDIHRLQNLIEEKKRLQDRELTEELVNFLDKNTVMTLSVNLKVYCPEDEYCTETVIAKAYGIQDSVEIKGDTLYITEQIDVTQFQ